MTLVPTATATTSSDPGRRLGSTRRRHTRLLASVAAGAITIAACSGSEEAVPDTTTAVTTTTIQPPPVGDGRLVIGLLLPVNDPELGASLSGAAELAIERVNDAGGVLDRSVRTVTADEGSSAADTAGAIQTLLAQDVDAIVGPASSVITLSVLDDIVAAGTVACSPTASTLALDGFPDDDLFFRTVPSDSLQAEAIAEVADQTGSQRAAVVFADDAYGRGLEEVVTGALAGGPITVVDDVPLPLGDEGFDTQARRLVESEAQIAIVLADATTTARFLESLDAFDDTGLTAVITNDAVRSASTAQRIAGLGPTLRTKILGVGPQAESDRADTPFDPPGPFAANAYDCVNLIALAAEQVGSDAPRDIAGQMASVSASGSVCREYADCLASLDAGILIDYNGPSGVTDLLARRGDPARAVFDRFTFDEEGRDVLQRTFIVGS